MSATAAVLVVASCTAGDNSSRPAAQGGGNDTLRWTSLPVSYCLDLSQGGYADDATFATLVQEAFQAWGVPARVNGRCDEQTKEGDHKNEIGWGSPPVPPANGPDVYEAGYTRLRYHACTHNCHGATSDLLEADIIIDRHAPGPYRNSRCLYAVLLHEVGHFLGLPHLAAPSVMSAMTTSCPQAPTEADRRALSDLYGADLTRR